MTNEREAPVDEVSQRGIAVDEVRKLFEAKFPVPEQLVFSDGQNAYLLREECEVSHERGAWITAAAWNARFEGFRAAHELLAKDVERMDYLQAHLLAADFNYGEYEDVVIVIEWPASVPIGANLRTNIDAALAAQEPK